jgi:hypothetical protein
MAMVAQVLVPKSGFHKVLRQLPEGGASEPEASVAAALR